MVICQTDKLVLWQLGPDQTQEKRWDIYKIDEKGFWHWIDENNPKHYYSLEEAKIGFLLESI